MTKQLLARRCSTTVACFVWVLCAGSIAQPLRKTDVQHDGLKGQVRTVLTETAKLSVKKGQLGESRRSFSSSWTYDREGRLIEERAHGSYRTYRYDGDGTRYEARSIHPTTSALSLDDFRFQQERSYDGSFLYKWTSKYDASGNRIEEGVFSGVREPHSRLFYRYDDKGRRIEVTRQVLGAITFRAIYSYDAMGRLEEKTTYEEGAATPSERANLFEFDSTGNWIKATLSKPRKKSGKISIEPVEVTYRTITYY